MRTANKQRIIDTFVNSIYVYDDKAVAENPELLVLDEPMNGLDKDGVADMRRYLFDLKAKGKLSRIFS